MVVEGHTADYNVVDSGATELVDCVECYVRRIQTSEDSTTRRARPQPLHRPSVLAERTSAVYVLAMSDLENHHDDACKYLWQPTRSAW